MVAHISDDGFNREESVAEHTEKTTFLCQKKGVRCGMAQIMSLCGIIHDLGKNKQIFADYLYADENERHKLRGTIAHASTGAKYIYDRYHENDGITKIMVEMISYAVAAHHGLFDCVDIELKDIFSIKINEVDDYDEACRNAERDYLDRYKLDKIFVNSTNEFHLIWNKIKDLFTRLQPMLVSNNQRDVRGKLSECRLFLCSALQRLILSMLIDADWEATSDFMDSVDTLSKQSELNVQEIFRQAQENFEAYMQKKQCAINTSQLTDKETEIFEARNSLQDECRQFAKHPAGIYCLPIPTGGGKTLSSLAYALEYCRIHPETERIIYVSPYISITEQNAQVFRDAIGNDSWILEHHSSVIRNEETGSETGSEDYRIDSVSKFDINWEEPFICTTFVQFMNTLFSDKSESVRRMHRLVNSVVIIDEVQSMPMKCVHTFNYMINFLNAVCNTDIILCTATQPTLAEAKCPICYSEPKYMIENADSWFRKFDRVKIYTPKRDKKYTFESLGNEIAEQSAEYKSILVVLNTKSAVRRLYDILTNCNIHVQYLTTNLCAEHRSDKIKAIKEVLEKKRETIVVVSTNLIEAGVDISFECVYRSMTGLDSLAQTAGRCNRNGELDCGNVHLVALEDENTGNMEELQQNIRVTENVLLQYDQSNRDHQGEKRDSILMPKWMDKYYENMYYYASDKMNFPLEKLDTNIMELLSCGFYPEEKRNQMNQAYKTAGQAYRVIDDCSFGVIVPYKKGAEIIEKIQMASDMAEIKVQIRQAQRYTVNIRGEQLKKYDGLIQPISDKLPQLYMVAAPGAYNMEYGITPEWETLIF
ncbi:MAG: CRISPR-associated helicase Cas3' [Lachnospiraceae bacterium]|nr:CRISPR-associated helicase Cas3' [Lachnospiraceae bacterium]